MKQFVNPLSENHGFSSYPGISQTLSKQLENLKPFPIRKTMDKKLKNNLLHKQQHREHFL